MRIPSIIPNCMCVTIAVPYLVAISPITYGITMTTLSHTNHTVTHIKQTHICQTSTCTLEQQRFV